MKNRFWCDNVVKTKVVHSKSKNAWNVIGDTAGCKFTVARVPYSIHENTLTGSKGSSKQAALEDAKFISYCFNNQDSIGFAETNETN